MFLERMPPSLILISIALHLIIHSNVIAYNPIIPNLGHKEMVGIWRLTSKVSFSPQRTSTDVITQQEKGNKNDDGILGLKEHEQDMLLMLRKDGSFVHYDKVEAITDDAEEEDDNDSNDESYAAEKRSDDNFANTMKSRTLQGTWNYREGKLILATDRPPSSGSKKVDDTILIGKVLPQVKERNSPNDDTPPSARPKSSKETQPTLTSKYEDENSMSKDLDIHLAILDGEISVGKFTYPKKHPSFFEQPIFKPTIIGTFQLYQTLGSIKIRSKRSVEQKQKVERFKKEEFYNKKFLLTTMPVEPKRGLPKLVWKRSEGKYIDEKKTSEDPDRTIDIRVMPITFFSNNTFCATGTNKILRGRFEITGDEKDQLLFDVSLFGSGRSVSGSIYSEGKGLTHDDKRSYLGAIERREINGNKDPSSSDSSKFFVKGSAVFGTDLGTDARPEPVAGFTMQEVTESLSVNDDDDDDDLSDDDTESIFQ